LVKRWLILLFLLSWLLSACASTSTPAPYSPDTPSPPQIDAPLIETPALITLQFFNSLDGWGVTETQIVRTNDGGVTWYNVTPPSLTETGYQVVLSLTDNLHAWALLPDLANYPNSGTLYRTADGGLSWTSFPVPFSGADLRFLDAENGWALADLGVGAGSNAVAVFQTTDGGATWAQKFTNDPNLAGAGDSLPLGGLKAGIAPVNMQTAFVYGVTYAPGAPYLFRTDDGGATWSPVSLPLPPGAQNAELSIERGQMKFLNPAEGFIAMRLTSDGYQLAIYTTSDGGITWTLTPNTLPASGVADFLSAQEAVVFGGDQFYVTRDAARTWSIVLPDVKFGEVFAGMDFTDSMTGWVVTMTPTGQRAVYRTGDGGATWFPIVP
jgi:photosystem II stability/assembly factor-like uncharacterized protein